MRAIDTGRHVCLIESDQIGGAGVMWGALASKTMWELAKDFKVASKIDRGYRAAGLVVETDVVVPRQLLTGILQLDRRHVDDVQPRVVPGQVARQFIGKITVYAGDLQHAALRRRVEVVQYGLGESLHVTPEDEVDHPFALE